MGLIQAFIVYRKDEAERWHDQIVRDLDYGWRRVRKARVLYALGFHKLAARYAAGHKNIELAYRMAKCSHNPYNGGKGSGKGIQVTYKCAHCEERVKEDSILGWLHVDENPVDGSISGHTPEPFGPALSRYGEHYVEQ